MRQSLFERQVTFALVLLLLVATIYTMSASLSPEVQQFIAFVLTHDLDLTPVLETVHVSVDWPFLRWLGLTESSSDENVTDAVGR